MVFGVETYVLFADLVYKQVCLGMECLPTRQLCLDWVQLCSLEVAVVTLRYPDSRPAPTRVHVFLGRPIFLSFRDVSDGLRNIKDFYQIDVPFLFLCFLDLFLRSSRKLLYSVCVCVSFIFRSTCEVTGAALAPHFSAL